MRREVLKQIAADQLLAFNEGPLGITRALPENFNLHLGSPDITVITGVRRCGKSTLFRQLRLLLPADAVALFLDLEHPLLESPRIAELQTIYEIWLELVSPVPEQQLAIFYDEIQIVPHWERWVRQLAEKRNHKVFVTGSNSHMLSSEMASSLTGRHRPISLFPFSFFELREDNLNYSTLSPVERQSLPTKVAQNKLIDSLLKIGGFPRCHLEKDTSLLPLYFNDIITRDIIRRRKVRNSAALLRLGEILCRENTRLFNRNKTGKLLGLKDNSTLANYLEYFKETFLFYELRHYSPALRKQLRSLSKFYCIDPALPRAVAGSASTGYSAEFENLVFLELKRYLTQRNLRHSISYWHSQHGRETDFLIATNEQLYAIQSAYSVTDKETLDRELFALKDANKELGVTNLFIITATESQTIEENGLRFHVRPLAEIRTVLP